MCELSTQDQWDEGRRSQSTLRIKTPFSINLNMKKPEYQINERWKKKNTENNTTEGHIGMQIESNTNKLQRINENLLT